jgi:hypothetical protein
VTDVTDLSVTSGFSLPARVRTLGSTCELSVTSVTSVTGNGQDIDLKRLIGMLEKILDPSQSVTTRHNPSQPVTIRHIRHTRLLILMDLLNFASKRSCADPQKNSRF